MLRARRLSYPTSAIEDLYIIIGVIIAFYLHFQSCFIGSIYFVVVNMRKKNRRKFTLAVTALCLLYIAQDERGPIHAGYAVLTGNGNWP